MTPEKFEQFGREVWEWFTKNYAEGNFKFEEDGEEFMEIAEKHGLASRVLYDPKKHGLVEDVDEGDEMWFWGEENKL